MLMRSATRRDNSSVAAVQWMWCLRRCVAPSAIQLTSLYCFSVPIRWLVWRRRNGVGHINKFKLRRARLVLGLVTFSGSTIPVFVPATQADSAWPSLRGSVQWVQWFWPSLEKRRRVLRRSEPVGAGLLYAGLIGSTVTGLKLEGDELPGNQLRVRFCVHKSFLFYLTVEYAKYGCRCQLPLTDIQSALKD